jgi:hypothetical protein
MKVLLLQVDGKLPNLALMRIAAYHRELGDEVSFRRADHVNRCSPQFGEAPDRVYASAIFTKSAPLCREIKRQFPGAVIGGSGWDIEIKLENVGVPTDGPLDYSLYPSFPHSMGFSQRGCRLRCGFCLVPQMEGAVRDSGEIAGIWRGDPHPRNLLLLDNDFFGQPEWRRKVEEIRSGGFRVSFNQGINARFLTDEVAEAIASIDYYDDDFKRRCLYTAWDNRKDEKRLFDGLERLVKYGVKPDQIMVYMLVGYWPGETHEDRDYRRRRLTEFGARPFPMAWEPTMELLGYQRWVIRRIHLKVSWEDFSRARYQPANLRPAPTFPLLEVLP